jgi:hypothetical protein
VVGRSTLDLDPDANENEGGHRHPPPPPNTNTKTHRLWGQCLVEGAAEAWEGAGHVPAVEGGVDVEGGGALEENGVAQQQELVGGGSGSGGGHDLVCGLWWIMVVPVCWCVGRDCALVKSRVVHFISSWDCRFAFGLL